jgi:hypothetical protein
MSAVALLEEVETMAILRQGDLLIGDFLLTREAQSLSPKYTLIATDPRRTLADRVAAAKAADMMYVALNQPHRRGDADKDCADLLAQFCERFRLRPECMAAGIEYRNEVRAEKAARGFRVIDQAPGEGDELTEEQQAAKNWAAIAALNTSNMVLGDVNDRCARRMADLCYYEIWPGPYQESTIIRGLLALARHYALLDEGINRDKAI